MSSRLVGPSGRWHQYTLDGERVPSVTTIIGKLDKPGLVKWAARESALWAAVHRDALDELGEASWVAQCTRASDEARDLAMRNGTQVHDLAERLIWGEPVDDEDENGLPWSDDVRAMGEQLVRFLDAWQAEPVLVEASVFHEQHRWAGRVDLVADLADGARWCIDYKTGQSGVWPETALQVGAYGNATHVRIGVDRDDAMPAVDKFGAVWLRPDGWELVPLHVDEDTYRTFGHLRRIYEWTRLRREDVVGGPLPIPAA